MSLSRFAESMAEEVIDGRVLRHSFESLDDDGSGAISSQELYDELKPLCSELTMEDIQAHIAASEIAIPDAEGEAEDDQKLDYNEYMQLFPGRLRRVKAVEDRISFNLSGAEQLQQKFDSVKDKVRSWMKALDSEATAMNKLSSSLDREGVATFRELKKRLAKVATLLQHPPGPKDLQHQMEVHQAQQRRRRKCSKELSTPLSAEYGFDSFVQDHAVHCFWPVLVDAERKMIKHAIHTDNAGHDYVDVFKVSDAVQFVVKKIDEVLEWTRYQLEEYESITDVLSNAECGMHSMVYSGRGLQKHKDDSEDEGGDMQDHDAHHADNTHSKKSTVFSRFIERFGHTSSD